MAKRNDKVVSGEIVPSLPKGGPELRKANESIAIRPTAGKLTFLSRKLFNVLLYNAQRHGDQPSYRMPLSELVSSVEFDSHDTNLLREHLRRLRSTEVEWNDPQKSWGISGLVGEAGIVFDGKRSYVQWEYTSKIRSLLLDPRANFTPIPLQFQTILRTHAGLALFEICSRYESNHKGLTNRATPEWWYPVLAGSPQSAEPLDYRYFKRDIIKRAIDEINSLTDLEVTLIEHKQGRKVIEIQFSVKRASQSKLELPPPPVIDSVVLERLAGLGLSKMEAEEVYGATDETLLRSTIALVEERMRNTKLPPLSSPAAFFKTALRQGYAATKLPAPKNALISESAAVATPASDESRARDAARAHFAELAEDARISLLAEFEASVTEPLLKKRLRAKGLDSKLNEVPFMNWLAARLAESG